MTCYLVGASPAAEQINPRAEDYVIAVDGGLRHLHQWGIAPELMLGDFDSFAPTDPMLTATVPQMRFPREKDETDMELALRAALQMGFRRLELIGGSGGRPDHTFANLQLLVRAARQGAFAVLRGSDGFSVTALTDQGTLALRGQGTVSLFAYGEIAEGVTVRGMRYPLSGASLRGDTPRGVSNEMAGETAEITMTGGVLLVYWQTDSAEPLVNF
jgi:thiamine pyrophosphokinase